MALNFKVNLVGKLVERKGYRGDGKRHIYFKIGAEKLSCVIGKPRKLFSVCWSHQLFNMDARFGGGSMSICGWRQLERIQKHLMTSNLKVKTSVPYDILLAEASTFPLEASSIIRLISYLKKVENMSNQRWPKIVMEEGLNRRKKTWMKQNKKWLNKWNIQLHECLNTNGEIKKFVIEKFQTAMWTNHIGCKKAYYIKEFNPTGEHNEKAYLGTAIKGKAKLLLAQLRIGSHHLRYETGRWQRPKEVWEERTCLFYKAGAIETEHHFLIECTSYDDIRAQYEFILKDDNMYHLFDEDNFN